MLKRTPLQRKTPLKSNSTQQLSRKPIKAKKKSQETILKEKEDRDRMKELFERHWESKPKVCESCNSPIYGENLSIYSHHCLEKGLKRYDHLKYELTNLMLLCGDCHSSTTNGHSPKAVVERTEWVKERYGVM